MTRISRVFTHATGEMDARVYENGWRSLSDYLAEGWTVERVEQMTNDETQKKARMLVILARPEKD